MKTRFGYKSGLLLMGVAMLSTAGQAATEFGGARLLSQPDANHTKSTKGTISLHEDTQQLSFLEKGQQTVSVPYADISDMRLEQTVQRLRVPFTGRVQHSEYLTIRFQDGSGKPAYAVFQLRGPSYREVVAALEAQVKKPVEWRNN